MNTPPILSTGVVANDHCGNHLAKSRSQNNKNANGDVWLDTAFNKPPADGMVVPSSTRLAADHDLSGVQSYVSHSSWLETNEQLLPLDLSSWNAPSTTIAQTSRATQESQGPKPTSLRFNGEKSVIDSGSENNYEWYGSQITADELMDCSDLIRLHEPDHWYQESTASSAGLSPDHPPLDPTDRIFLVGQSRSSADYVDSDLEYPANIQYSAESSSTIEFDSATVSFAGPTLNRSSSIASHIKLLSRDVIEQNETHKRSYCGQEKLEGGTVGLPVVRQHLENAASVICSPSNAYTNH